MLKRTYDGQDCSIARALEVVGERWTLLIIRDALLGLRRFDEFQRNLGIARRFSPTAFAGWSTKESSSGFPIKNGRSGTSTT